MLPQLVQPILSRRLRAAMTSAVPVLWVGLVGCSGAEAIQPPAQSAARLTRSVLSDAETGIINLLTYNVAGLPAIISPSDPERNMPRVSPLLNAYDVVLAQEDFAYHKVLVHAAGHPYQHEPKPPRDAFVGNGLATLSVFPVDGLEHVEWENCNGYLTALSDCLSEKGFTVGTLHLTASVSVDIYNIHADAGDDEGDIEARQLEYTQLARFISERSADRAVVLAGDTNLDGAQPKDRATLERFLQKTDLVDSCRQADCVKEEIDRVLTRSSTALELRAVRWEQDARFVDEQGVDLSDHPAVAVRIAWHVR